MTVKGMMDPPRSERRKELIAVSVTGDGLLMSYYQIPGDIMTRYHGPNGKNFPFLAININVFDVSLCNQNLIHTEGFR